MQKLQKKIDEIDKKLDKNRDELWEVTERKRVLTAELISLREQMFNQIREEE